MESALMISPFIFTANSTASLLFPEQVGPVITNINPVNNKHSSKAQIKVTCRLVQVILMVKCLSENTIFKINILYYFENAAVFDLKPSEWFLFRLNCLICSL